MDISSRRSRASMTVFPDRDDVSLQIAYPPLSQYFNKVTKVKGEIKREKEEGRRCTVSRSAGLMTGGPTSDLLAKRIMGVRATFVLRMQSSYASLHSSTA